MDFHTVALSTTRVRKAHDNFGMDKLSSAIVMNNYTGKTGVFAVFDIININFHLSGNAICSIRLSVSHLLRDAPLRISFLRQSTHFNLSVL